MLAGSWANKVSIKLMDQNLVSTLQWRCQTWECTPSSVRSSQLFSDSFQEKDYLNGRFFYKRSFYLTTIAAAIQSPKSGFNVEVFYESLLEDVCFTNLVLVPKFGRSLALHPEALGDRICRWFPYWLYQTQCSSKHCPRSIALISNSPPPPLTFSLKYPHKCKRRYQATNTPVRQRPSPLIYTKIWPLDQLSHWRRKAWLSQTS